ncbi:MAG: SAF domain-containing protein [Myxococcaceae bacterium]|nr:SAF domain-containing protein [Myxococcaceae bacterium]
MAERGSSWSGLMVGVLVGVPLGLVGGFGVAKAARSRSEAAWTTGPVLVTSRELLAGHVVTVEDLEERTWPRLLITESCATPATRARFVGKPLRWRVGPDTVVRDTDLVEPEPSCAERVKRVLESVDGGAPGLAGLGAALIERHGGAR